jgi:hypothetical protein
VLHCGCHDPLTVEADCAKYNVWIKQTFGWEGKIDQKNWNQVFDRA